jgi:hypothetical protein
VRVTARKKGNNVEASWALRAVCNKESKNAAETGHDFCKIFAAAGPSPLLRLKSLAQWALHSNRIKSQ